LLRGKKKRTKISGLKKKKVQLGRSPTRKSVKVGGGGIRKRLIVKR